ncbi:serine hydrolase [Nonomuraea angiospora]|uniref:serine hydrolase n=1 Tax=Nonomuraea angiospora TaxID=46172 RepID=UPI0029BAE073|nr:serine hydrolase [Nonomuraea angiospora]MDX3103239.1 serine hydrolase [Nonomuraea angiospora]
MNLSRSRNRSRGLAGLATAAVLLGGLVAPPPAAAAEDGSASVLAHHLRRALDQLQFEQVLDTNPPVGTAGLNALRQDSVDKEARKPPKKADLLSAVAAAEPISQQPQIDLTVIELNRAGRPVSSGTVLMSPQYPDGKVVPVDRNLHTTDVRWRQWDDAGWYANHGQGTIDVVPGRENASIDFMSPYPASVLKLMVAFGVLRLVDQGQISLDDTYDYQPTTISSLCGPASSNTVRNYLDASLTWSSNAATCAMVKLLHDRGAVDGLNQTFQDLGLETLQLKNTNPANGARWGNPVTMSSLDTAKLLMLVNGGLGTLWTAPNGTAVTAAVLSDASRAFFKGKLGDQGMNVALSTTNWCGAAYPAPGIPQLTPSRWIGADGTVTIPGQGITYGHDVRPCNEAAEVTYAHKNGWVNNSGADAGIVKALPGKGGRTYVVTMFSNLGYQYVDSNRPPTGAENVWFTEKFAKLGKIIDDYEKRRYP